MLGDSCPAGGTWFKYLIGQSPEAASTPQIRHWLPELFGEAMSPMTYSCTPSRPSMRAASRIAGCERRSRRSIACLAPVVRRRRSSIRRRRGASPSVRPVVIPLPARNKSIIPRALNPRPPSALHQRAGEMRRNRKFFDERTMARNRFHSDFLPGPGLRCFISAVPEQPPDRLPAMTVQRTRQQVTWTAAESR